MENKYTKRRRRKGKYNLFFFIGIIFFSMYILFNNRNPNVKKLRSSLDLNNPQVRTAVFQARANVDKELIILAVGDTRDQRREEKDPNLSHISTDFVANIALNFKSLDIRHFIVLASSQSLCKTLYERYPQVFDTMSCGYSTAYYDTNYEKWGLKKGDMFLVWAQQWLLVSQALEEGYGIMRVDNDVVFLENPYPIIHGPLLSQFRSISQLDFAQPETVPSCTSSKTMGILDICKNNSPNIYLNIGLIYFRKHKNHLKTPLYDFFNALNHKFLTMLSDEHGGGSTKILDQPIFRKTMEEFYNGPPKVVKPSRRLDSVYPIGECPHKEMCKTIQLQREKSAFSIINLKGKTDQIDILAAAPVWLFGRMCLRTFSDGDKYVTSRALSNCTTRTKATMHSPQGGGLVAVHAVYSKAIKRVDAMKIMGWWQFEEDIPQDIDRCSGDIGMVFSHEYYRHNPKGYRAFMCSGRPRTVGGCACCSNIPHMYSLPFLKYTNKDELVPVSTEKQLLIQQNIDACGMDSNGGWNEFWD